MRKLKENERRITIHDLNMDCVQIEFRDTSVRFSKFLGICNRESEFTLFDCNPEQIANELLRWVKKDSEAEMINDEPSRHVKIGSDRIQLWINAALHGQIAHSIPDFKSKLAAELERILEPEEKTITWEGAWIDLSLSIPDKSYIKNVDGVIVKGVKFRRVEG